MAEPSRDDRRRWVLAILDEYEGRLVRFAARILGDEHAARDVAQHVFLRLCDESRELPRERVASWLFTVCRNRALDLLRGRRPSDPFDQALNVMSGEPDPAETAEAHDLYRKVRQAVAALPAVQREAIDLWSEGFSYREIADITGYEEVSVRVQVHRGLTRLRCHPSLLGLQEGQRELR
jgi:RNA polymerase sigma-70 factor (ECF subfamily)